MSKKYSWICDCCGCSYEITSSQYHRLKDGRQKSAFCSIECKALSQKRRVVIQCSYCGKDIEKTEYQASAHQNHFCSKECSAKYKHDTTTEERICEICGKPYETKKISPQRFCTPDCANEYQKTRIGRLSPHFRGVEVECEWCKKPFDISPYKVELSERHFCSRQCQREWYAQVFSQRSDFKQRIREKAIERMSNQSMPQLDTKPQLIINNILDDLKIPYVREYNAKYYAIDNYLPNNNLMIEVQGDYYHSNPKRYSTIDNLNDTQLQRVGKDKAKHTYIKNQYQIEVLYLWESDIINSPKLCEKLIEKYVNENGKLDNYHSFNYIMDGDDLTLSSTLVTPFQDIK